MPQLLLELFQEEIPARMQAQAADDLKRLMIRALTDRGLAPEGVNSFVTPRRLTLVVDDLPAASADVSEELKGPRVAAPPAALDGFLKKTGLAKDQLTVQADAKGDFYIAKISKPGRPAPALIAEAVSETVKGFPWPKSMHWEPSGLQWVRPLRSVLCLFAGEIVPFQLAGLAAGNITRGHRQMANEPFEVRDFDDYKTKLAERRVVLDADTRKAMILDGAKDVAEKAGLVFRDDPELLDEVAGLVECPVVLAGQFEEAYLDVPAEVLVTTMRKNQKYFALEQTDGRLANTFLIVSNLEARDGGKAIIAGNERVVRARLADAKFFWDLDKQTRLEDLLPKLKDIVFHAKLGTQWDRVQRIERLAGEIAERIGADVAQAKLAARLAKADLVTGTVGEFPEVQGIAGGYLVRDEGLPDAVADAVGNAVADHYRPQGPSDRVPTDKVSIAVALADKIDTLVGFFAIDEKPTGSKDPYALRRAALGVVRLILQNTLRIAIMDFFAIALNNMRPGGGTQLNLKRMVAGRQIDERLFALLEFLADRMKANLRDRGIRHDLVDAVFALSQTSPAIAKLDPALQKERAASWDASLMGGRDDGGDLMLLVHRAEALQSFLSIDDGKNLLAGYKRAANILRIEEKKDKTTYEGSVDDAKLGTPEEKALAAAIDQAMPVIDKAVAAEDFSGAMTALAQLRAPVDAFFEKVKVNDDDAAVRVNRLNLLARIKQAAHLVADFSKIEG